MWIRVGWIASEQHGVIALWQLRGLGLPGSTVRARVGAGHLHPLHSGVYAVGHRAIGPLGRSLAAALACGPGAAACGRTAVHCYGLGLGRRSPVDVAVLAESHRRRPGIVVHRLTRLERDDLTVRNGIPVTALPRTLLDLAAAAGPSSAREVLARAQRSGALDIDALAELVARSGGLRGIAILREAAAELLPGGGVTRRGLEWRFLLLCRRAELPEPIVNGLIRLEHRTLQVDFHWPAERLIVETDGYESHSDLVAHEEDRRRDQELARLGWEVLRFTWRQVTNEPARTARIVAEVLAARQSPDGHDHAER